MANTSRFELERIEAPSQEEFERRFLKPGRPVLIKGVVDKWPAARWNPDQLLSRVGGNQVPVSVMSDRRHPMTRPAPTSSLVPVARVEASGMLACGRAGSRAMHRVDPSTGTRSLTTHA